MRKIIGIVLLLLALESSQAQNILGKWKTIDDATKVEKSIVEIYEKEGKVYAKVLELLETNKKGSLCTECHGKDKNKPIEGLLIINGLQKDGDEWNGGKILDPKSGKEYKCYITLEDTNKLKVRGYIGFSLIGRTQYWYRVK